MLNNIKYVIEKSNRKSVALVFNEKGELKVKAPKYLSNKVINKIVLDKKEWIAVKSKMFQKRKHTVSIKKYDTGKKMLFFGKEYNIAYSNDICSVRIVGDKLLIPDDFINDKNKVLDFIKNKLYDYIVKKAEYYSNTTGIEFEKIKISSAKKRWGSCSTKGNLNFSYRLFCAPTEVIDYIIVHEIVHIIYFNHSIKFWNKVKEIIPDYRKRKEWINNNGYLINAVLDKFENS